MDNIDRATAQAEYEEQERLARLERRLKRPNFIGTTRCVDCGDPIPAARRAANPQACRCSECQHYLEKENRYAPR